MRILQLIDSLHAGGAERVAVNFANAFASKIDGSFICATREEGLLKQSINSNVGYLFLNRSKTIDVKAIYKLNKYIKKQKIDIIHAHSSSFFLATLIKFLNKTVKIVWHDHYGNSEFLDTRKSNVLKFCSKYFSHVFCVNTDLELWAQSYLKIDRVSYLPNYAVKNDVAPTTILKGVTSKRIVCLANLRPQKDHLTLIRAFSQIIEKHPEWTLHCVGKDFNDDYSANLNEQITLLNLSNHVYLYGSRPDISNILGQCEIGVLSSKSEGLPIALLEYGLAHLAVIVTDVGDCKKVIQNNVNGVLVEKSNSKLFKDSLEVLISDEELRHRFAKKLNSYVNEFWSEEKIIDKLYNFYKKLSEFQR